jgi:hypothetical protein
MSNLRRYKVEPERCPGCNKYTVEHDKIAHIKKCLNTSCLWQEYGNKKVINEMPMIKTTKEKVREVIRWLEEPCTEHNKDEGLLVLGEKISSFPRRFNCPVCRQQIKKEYDL